MHESTETEAGVGMPSELINSAEALLEISRKYPELKVTVKIQNKKAAAIAEAHEKANSDKAPRYVTQNDLDEASEIISRAVRVCGYEPNGNIPGGLFLHCEPAVNFDNGEMRVKALVAITSNSGSPSVNTCISADLEELHNIIPTLHCMRAIQLLNCRVPRGLVDSMVKAVDPFVNEDKCIFCGEDREPSTPETLLPFDVLPKVRKCLNTGCVSNRPESYYEDLKAEAKAKIEQIISQSPLETITEGGESDV